MNWNVFAMNIGKNDKLSKQDATLIQGSETVNFDSLHALGLVLYIEQQQQHPK